MVYLNKAEKRELTLGLVAGVITGTISIILASTYLAKKASEAAIERTMSIQDRSVHIQTEYIGKRNIYGMNIENKEPKLTVSITTSEFYNGEWTPVLMHRFYGESEEELADLINAHRTTDAFFRASFDGIFNWKGSTIKLKNSEPKIEYSR